MAHLGRWLRALTTSDSFTVKANEVQDVMVDIRRLCEELLDKNVHSIKTLTISKFPMYDCFIVHFIVLTVRIAQKENIEGQSNTKKSLLANGMHRAQGTGKA